MLCLWSVVLFSLAVSLDGFGVGLSYGIRQIRIPLTSLLVICLTSASAITISMYSGQLLASYISPHLAEKIGAVILVCVGVWTILEAWSKYRRVQKAQEAKEIELSKEYPLMSFKVPGIGIVIQILKEPSRADFDRSGVINLQESLALGFALAMDALGAGFGAAVAGYKPLLVPLFVGGFKFVLVSGGLWMGSKFGVNRWGRASSAVPGIILIILGMMKI